MTTTDFARVRELVEAAHALAPAERARFLDSACGSNLSLRAEVESVLDSADSGGSFLAPVDVGLDFDRWMPVELQLAPQQRIGGFRLVRRIAIGGMGTIWEAEQDEPRRTVALKTMRFGEGSAENVRRFRDEAQILARLGHPHVAQVFAAGVERLADGRELSWYAMELIEGARTLVEFASERALDVRERLALFVELCDAVQHAHERGVIHRDLKPSNVLLDRAGRLKVIDFGVARMRDDRLRSAQTEAGRVLGTLPYMSPEQLSGASQDLDVRSDVYALGVVLYELLTGVQPFELAGVALAEAARAVCDVAPRAPSSLQPSLAVDLDAIALTALEKDRARRYASAASLGADVERFLRGEPVEARAPSVSYHLRVFARRHRVMLASLAAVLSVFAIATAVSLTFAVRANTAEAAEHRAAHDAIEQRDAARFREYTAEIAAAYAALRGLDPITARQHLDRCDENSRGFEWWSLERRVDRSLWTRTGDGSNVIATLWHPDGSRIFVAFESGAVEVREARSGERIAQTFVSGPLNWMDLDSSGRRLALSARSQVSVLDANSLELERSLAVDARVVNCAVFTPGGRTLLAAGARGAISEWDLESGARLRDLERAGSPAACAAASPDGRWFAIGLAIPNQVVLWDYSTGEISARFDGHTGYVSCVAFDRAGTMLVSASHDHTLRVWDPQSNALLRVLRGHDDLVMRATFDASGERLASSGWDRTVRVWDPRDGRLFATFFGASENVGPIAFSPDGTRLIAGDGSSHLKLWNASASNAEVATVRGKWLWKLRFWPDSASLLAVHGGFADRHATASERVLANYPYHSAEWRSAAIAPDGESIALGDALGHLSIQTADGSASLVERDTARSGLLALDWGGRDALLVGGSDDGVIWRFDGEARTPVALSRAGASIHALALEPKGSRLAFAGARGELRLVDASSGAVLFEGEPTFASALDLVWSADARRIAVAYEDGRVLLFDADEKRCERELLGHAAGATAVAFSPDGARLASGSIDRSVRLWEPSTGREILTTTDHAYRVEALAFSPDGSTLASGSSDSTLRWWSAGSRAEREVAIASRTALLARDVRAELVCKPSLDAAVRAEALAQTDDLNDDPRELAREAWITASAPRSEPTLIRVALEQARAARERLPSDAAALRAIVAVDVRLGRAADALAELDRGPALERDDWIGRALGVIARAHAGQLDGLRAELDSIDSDWASAGRPYRSSLRTLLEEARSLTPPN